MVLFLKKLSFLFSFADFLLVQWEQSLFCWKFGNDGEEGNEKNTKNYDIIHRAASIGILLLRYN